MSGPFSPIPKDEFKATFNLYKRDLEEVSDLTLEDLKGYCKLKGCLLLFFRLI